MLLTDVLETPDAVILRECLGGIFHHDPSAALSQHGLVWQVEAGHDALLQPPLAWRLRVRVDVEVFFVEVLLADHGVVPLVLFLSGPDGPPPLHAHLLVERDVEQLVLGLGRIAVRHRAVSPHLVSATQKRNAICYIFVETSTNKSHVYYCD